MANPQRRSSKRLAAASMADGVLQTRPQQAAGLARRSGGGGGGRSLSKIRASAFDSGQHCPKELGRLAARRAKLKSHHRPSSAMSAAEPESPTIGQQLQLRKSSSPSSSLPTNMDSQNRALQSRAARQPTIHRAELHDSQPAASDQMDLIKSSSFRQHWHWDETDSSPECLVSPDKLEVCFHPECSESAAAIRGSEPLIRDGKSYYWEMVVYEKVYGTSVMFGLCTKDQSLHANDYCNLIGLDEQGWSLSHKGLIWHDGNYAHYTNAFPPNQTIIIGLEFNTMRGELSYFMNGKNLGVAFRGLNQVQGELYPVIGSTAKCTRIRLLGAYWRGLTSLKERSCFTLLKCAPDKSRLAKELRQQNVPINLINYLAQVARICDGNIASKPIAAAQDNQYHCDALDRRRVRSRLTSTMI